MSPVNAGVDLPAEPDVSILGVRISRQGIDEAVRSCRERVSAELGGYVCFVNVHTLTESRRCPALRAALEGSCACFADGLPVVWHSQLRSQPVRSRVACPDFTAEFLAKAGDLTHGFVGGAPGQAEKLASHFGLKATGYSTPVRPFSIEHAHEDWRTLLARCPESKAPAVVWIALGQPKQELWAQAVAPLAPRTLFFGIGAALDFLAGSKRRAPRWMQRAGLEWAFRLGQEPGRLWKRYLVGNTLFILRAAIDLAWR